MPCIVSDFTVNIGLVDVSNYPEAVISMSG